MKDLITLPKSRPKVREEYPLLASDVKERLGLKGRELACWRRHHAPDYTSKEGRVKRWRAPLPDVKCGIYGSNAATLHISRVILHPTKTPLCTGTWGQLDAILKAAVKRWHQLPKGREIATVAAEFGQPETVANMSPPPPRGKSRLRRSVAPPNSSESAA